MTNNFAVQNLFYKFVVNNTLWQTLKTSDMKKLLNMLLTLCGVSVASCIPVAMYGTPHINFTLKARVVDSEGNPIQGIEVRTKEGHYFEHNTGISDYQGNIEASGQIWPGSQYEVTFYDIDGEYNGGEFETLKLDISDKVKQTKKGDGDWYQGSYKAELGNVTLTLKEQNAEGEQEQDTNNEEE